MTRDSDDREWPPDGPAESESASESEGRSQSGRAAANDRDGDRGTEPETEPDRRDGYGVNRDYEHDSNATDRPTVDLQDGDRGTEPRSETEREPERDPDRDPNGDGDPTGPSAPDEDTIRIWTALTVSLAAISLGTAGAIALAYDAPSAVAGAIALSFGFGAIALAGRTRFPTVFGHLDDAWAEHRLYVWFSTGLFALGIAFGALLFAAGVDLTELFLELLEEEFGEEGVPGDPADEGQFELTATFFILNNTPPFLAAVFGALTLGLVTFVIMLFNGVLVGNIVAAVGADMGLGLVIALLIPHGIFELPALFIAAGVGFRFLHRVGQRLAGTREALFTRGYLARTVVLVAFAWLILVLAAFVEAYITFLVADTLFGL